MSWTVDGATMTTTTLQSQKPAGMISVAGTIPSSTNSIFLTLQFPNAVGTYTFNPASLSSAIYTAPGIIADVYYAGATPGAATVTGSGTIVVTALTATNVSGTFTFTGVNPISGASKSVTNGKFNVGL